MLSSIQVTVSHMQEVTNDESMPKSLKDKMTKYLGDLTRSTTVIHSSTKQLSLTVNDMLSLSQLDSNKFRIKLESFDIRDSVKEIMDI